MDSVCTVYAAAPQQNSPDVSISAVTWMEVTLMGDLSNLSMQLSFIKKKKEKRACTFSPTKVSTLEISFAPWGY